MSHKIRGLLPHTPGPSAGSKPCSKDFDALIMQIRAIIPSSRLQQDNYPTINHHNSSGCKWILSFIAIIAIGWWLLTEQERGHQAPEIPPYRSWVKLEWFGFAQPAGRLQRGFIFRNMTRLLYKYNFHLPTRLVSGWFRLSRTEAKHMEWIAGF